MTQKDDVLKGHLACGINNFAVSDVHEVVMALS